MEYIKPIPPSTMRNQEDVYQNVRDMVHKALDMPYLGMPRLNETEFRVRIQCEALARDIEKRIIDKLLELNTKGEIGEN